MDHAAIIYLMAPDGEFITVIPYQEDESLGTGQAEKSRGYDTDVMTNRRRRCFDGSPD